MKNVFEFSFGTVVNSKNLTITDFDFENKRKVFVDYENFQVEYSDGSMQKYKFPSSPKFFKGDDISAVFYNGSFVALYNNTRGGSYIFEDGYPAKHWLIGLVVGVILCFAYFYFDIFGVLELLAFLFIGLITVFVFDFFIKRSFENELRSSAHFAGMKSMMEEAHAYAESYAESSDIVTSKTSKNLHCFSCDEKVSSGVVGFCLQNKQRFDGRVFCMKCQKNH